MSGILRGQWATQYFVLVCRSPTRSDPGQSMASWRSWTGELLVDPFDHTFLMSVRDYGEASLKAVAAKGSLPCLHRSINTAQRKESFRGYSPNHELCLKYHIIMNNPRKD